MQTGEIEESFEFALLGPLRVRVDGRDLPIGAAKQRTVLAVLLAFANRCVPVADLIDEVWNHDPPESATANIRTYVRDLRRQLGPAGVRLRTCPGGYQLDARDDERDVVLFDRSVTAADIAFANGQWSLAHREYLRAQCYWHGEEVLADTPTGPRLGEFVERWREARLRTLESSWKVRIRTGDSGSVVTELREQLMAWPRREVTAALLAEALHASGDREEALRVLRRTRQALRQIGLDPGVELRELEASVLNGRTPITSPDRHVPAQLPMDVRGFVGRKAEVAELDSVASDVGHTLPHSVQGRSPSVIVVSGMAGVGKTALAVHWAHQARTCFPDGQLYANLRGFGATGIGREPTDLLHAWLSALGIPAKQIPHEMDDRAALFRSQLEGKRMLLLLDNARDATQVRALFPGTPDSLVLITSRDRLLGLTADPGAHSISVGLLSSTEAECLLADRVGSERIAAEPAAAERIVGYCAALPLALAITAARTAAENDLGLTAIADQLSASNDLSSFDIGDHTLDVRGAFTWSHRRLDAEAAWLFSVLGLHPGPTFSGAAAAIMAGYSMQAVAQPLQRLVDAHLITDEDERYSYHDLVHTFSRETGKTALTSSDRQAVLRRMVDHYLTTAQQADHLLDPHRRQKPVDQPAAGVILEALPDVADALQWFTAEYDVLAEVLVVAESEGLYRQVWQLAWSMTSFHKRRGRWTDQYRTQLRALTATHHGGDKDEQARVHRSLAVCAVRLGKYSEAETEFEQALSLFAESNNLVGQADTEQNKTTLLEQRGYVAEAVECGIRALQLYKRADFLPGQSDALDTIGWFLARSERYQEALPYLHEAVELCTTLQDYPGLAASLDSLGYVQHQIGAHREALRCYRQAIELLRAQSDLPNQAIVLENLGDVSLVTGHPRMAAGAWWRAVQLLEGSGLSGSATAERLRARLADPARG